MADRGKRVLSGFKSKKVLVFGDLMLDRYIWSEVSHLSPEAPVPTADVLGIDHLPGGSGNVAANVKALGGTPLIVGVTGRDTSSEKLKDALKVLGISTRHLITDPTRSTIVKTRVVAGSQHLLRIDREEPRALSGTITARILRRLEKLIPMADAVIISDYSKGLITETAARSVIRCAAAHQIPIGVDTKRTEYSWFKGATVITPNQGEASGVTGEEILDDQSLKKTGRRLLRLAGTEAVLITRGKEGMSLFSRSGGLHHIPAIPQKTLDIAGAGDTVIAALILALSARQNIEDAARLSNHAASVVVGKSGTASCFLEELETALDSGTTYSGKIKTAREIDRIVKELRKRKARIVFTNGCFDLLHPGHVRYLREAKGLGDVLIVGLNGDRSVMALKGKDRPFNPAQDRAEMLAALESVDFVTVYPDLRPDRLIRRIRPDVHVKGGDYRVEELPEKGLVEELGGRVVVVHPVPGQSTTGIVERILKRSR